jgi:ELWxxDGT repeat protein
LFFADDGANGQELWRTDGTFFGTVLVKDINVTMFQGCTCDWPLVFNGKLYFVASDGLSGRELWTSDGTDPGTQMIELNPGPPPSNPHSLTVVGNLLYFGASTASHPSSLWVNDGTAGGTYELYDTFSGYGPSVAAFSIANGYGRPFFSGSAGAGYELWTGNGRTFGSYQVQDINPGGDANPSLLTTSGGLLYFVANDGTSGSELWATDTLFDNAFEIAGFSLTFAPWSSVQNDCPAFCDLDFVVPGLEGIGALAATVNDTNSLFVLDDTPAAEPHYRARFLFDPDDFDPGEAQNRHRTRILIALSEQPQRRILTLVLIRQGVGNYRILLRTRRDDGTSADLTVVPITNAPHALEVEWLRASAPGANDGSARLWVDDLLAGTIGGVDNDTGVIDFVRLGAMTVKPGAGGTLLFDRFESRRRRYIGP